jgi:hypothetical protein
MASVCAGCSRPVTVDLAVAVVAVRQTASLRAAPAPVTNPDRLARLDIRRMTGSAAPSTNTDT